MMKRASILLLATTMLGGCISLLPEPPPPPRTFVLEAQNVAELSGPPVDAVVGIAQPTGELPPAAGFQIELPDQGAAFFGGEALVRDIGIRADRDV